MTDGCKTSLAVKADIGERLLNLCASDDSKVRCSLFSYKNIHNWTSHIHRIEAAQSREANVQRVFIGSCLEATLHLSLCVILLIKRKHSGTPKLQTDYKTD